MITNLHIFRRLIGYPDLMTYTCSQSEQAFTQVGMACLLCINKRLPRATCRMIWHGDQLLINSVRIVPEHHKWMQIAPEHLHMVRNIATTWTESTGKRLSIHPSILWQVTFPSWLLPQTTLLTWTLFSNLKCLRPWRVWGKVSFYQVSPTGVWCDAPLYTFLHAGDSMLDNSLMDTLQVVDTK